MHPSGSVSPLAIASETDFQKMKHTRVVELGLTETGLRLEISSLPGSFKNHSDLSRSAKGLDLSRLLFRLPSVLDFLPLCPIS